jgi:hypothetical protein
MKTKWAWLPFMFGMAKPTNLLWLFFALGAAARLALCWVNPPVNAFDDHFEPVLLILKTGTFPAKDACFQCYHPPVFYGTSAAVACLALQAGAEWSELPKVLQLLCCLYGILTVGICYLILKRFSFSDFARLLAFGTVCFLPRHIYMSAMLCNDTLAYLLVALSIYLAFRAVEKNFSIFSLAMLSVALTLAIFTKYTNFALIPMVLVPFLVALWKPTAFTRKKILAAGVGTFALPLLLLGAHLVSNQSHYHSPLPWNLSMYDPTAHSPHDPAGISFFSFKPWEDLRTPYLAPGKLHSFWTMLYSGMWFDTEPCFQRFLDSNRTWWSHYFAWYRGEETFPGPNTAVSTLTLLEAQGMIVLGVFPTALGLMGLYYCITGKWQGLVNTDPKVALLMNAFPVLLAANVAGVIGLTLRLPVYNSIKPSYLLSSMPAMMIFLAVGLGSLEKNVLAKRAACLAFSALFSLVVLHIGQIVLAPH